jgi:hypothetical protein
VTGACIFCKSTEHLNRRRLGEGGIEIDVCDRCSDLGQQARAVANTLRPLLPYAERAIGVAIELLFKVPLPRRR